jgi:hypothetical protein
MADRRGSKRKGMELTLVHHKQLSFPGRIWVLNSENAREKAGESDEVFTLSQSFYQSRGQ